MTDYIKKADAYRIAVHGTDPDVAYKIQQLKPEKHLNEIESQVPRWIPVTERLPENEGRYLAVFYEEMIIDFGYYRPSVGWCEQGITHWMPLPKAPDLT